MFNTIKLPFRCPLIIVIDRPTSAGQPFTYGSTVLVVFRSVSDSINVAIFLYFCMFLYFQPVVPTTFPFSTAKPIKFDDPDDGHCVFLLKQHLTIGSERHNKLIVSLRR